MDSTTAVHDGARPDAVARQHALGKLTARERIDRLLDPRTFQELGALVQSRRPTASSPAPVASTVAPSS